MKLSTYRIYLTIVTLCSGTALAEGWSLDEALRSAQERSPTAERVEATTRAAELARWEALTRLGPTASVSASLTRNDEETSVSFPAGVDPSTGQPVTQEVIVTPLEQTAASLTVSMPLLDPALWWGASSAARTLKATRIEGEDALALLRLSVAAAYLDAVVAQGRMEVASARLREGEARLARTRARADVGKERASAVLRTEADVLAARQEQEVASAEVALTLRVLSIYVGQPVQAPLAPIPLLDPGALDFDVGQSPSVLAAEQRARAASAARTQAAVAWLPRVDGRWSYSYSDTQTLQNPDGESWSASVTGTWTFFTTGNRAVGALRAQANAEVSAAAAEEARDAAERELARLSSQVTSTRASLGVAEARLSAAERAAQETRADYEEGAALLLDVEAAESSLLSARVGVVEAQAAAARAALSWLRASGRL